MEDKKVYTGKKGTKRNYVTRSRSKISNRKPPNRFSSKNSSAEHVSTSVKKLSGNYSVAYVTVPNQDVGKKIARGLVNKKLAACVNIIPQITSVYEWKNQTHEDSELLLMIKTRTEVVDALTKYVKENHPYDVCEVISLPIANGNEEYLKWIGEIVPSSLVEKGKPSEKSN